jgi:hypothetical protein
VADSEAVVDVTQAIKISGLVTSETIRMDSGGTLTTSGTVTNTGDLIAHGGTLKFDSASVAGAGHSITADGGSVTFTNTALTDTFLIATDNASSLIRFSGDVTFTTVPWVDPGAGEFQVVGNPTRLLGDYATQLPAGYTLVVPPRWGASA